MRHPEVTIETIGDFVKSLLNSEAHNTDGPSRPIWYRGQDRADWSLVPGIARPGNNVAAELTTIKRFKQSASQYLPQRPVGEWEWIFLMQHHRAPTRLLDWSESALVGLYFAVQDASYDADDAAVWCLDPIALNKTAGHNRAFDLDILAFGIDAVLDEYLPEKINERVAKLGPVAAIGPRNSARMVAQSGTFTVIHADPSPVESIGQGNHCWRIRIPGKAKGSLRRELRLLGVTEHSMFPDLDRVALLVKGLVQ